MRLPLSLSGFGQLCRARVIATGRIRGDGHSSSIQSNRDRAELVALRRLGR